MQAHFSILSASIRPEIQEQLTIGLLLVGSSSVYFETSKNKLSLVKELISPQAFKYLKETLNQVSQAASDENNRSKGLFEESKPVYKSFSSGYLEYLSRYSNNLLTFSSPKTIELQDNHDLFNMLFKKYIDEHELIETKNIHKGFDKIKSVFFTKVKPYFNIEKEISSVNVPGLVIPVKVDLIGKNETPVYAQTIDLERQNYHIQNDLAIIFMLNEALKNPKAFHVSSEPDKNSFPCQHEIWKSIKNWNHSEYVDLSEIQKIEDYATQHGVLPLIK
jgi:hypothetical protein